MKSIDRQSYPDSELTIFTAHGVISADTILEELHDYYGGQPTLHSLWDFSTADVTSISSDDISSLAHYIRQQIANRRGGKSALVFAKDLDFGLGRMIDAQLEIEGSPVAMSSFKSKADALGWLDISLPEREPKG
ncbi:MAG: hypothetical protein KQH59_14200 [Desulfobulbaceae bacterium]|nr:hypothetical protein [Desulfobulbaceae bacterium]